MKVLTKYLKVALCFMAFALCSFMFAFTPTLTAVHAAEMAINGYNVAINAIKMPTEEVDYNTPGKDVFRIPLLDSVMGTTSINYTIRVVDPAGSHHDYVTNGTEHDTSFFGEVEEFDGRDHLIVNAKNDGEYKVIYIVEENGRKYYSNSYKVNVTNVLYELDFSSPVLKQGTNQIEGYVTNLVKSKLAVSTSAYELPVAYAKIAGKDLTITDGAVTNEVASIKVTKDGAPQEVNKEGSVFTSNGGKFYLVPSEAGVYTVEYTFEDSANRPTKTFTINVEEGFVAEELKLASTPTMPKVELGKTIKLPKLTVNAGSIKNVDVNVESITIEKEADSNIKCVLLNNNFEFKMAPEMFEGVDNYADMVGNYRVTYVVKDAYGKTLTETFKVDGVTVSEKPTIKLVYNYDKEAQNLADKVVYGAEVELKAEYESNTEFVLPAVYVEDAITTNYNDFKVVRAIRKGSTYYYVDNVKYDETSKSLTSEGIDAKYLNASEDDNIGDINKAVKFKFAADAENIEGTYYLEYRVISNQVKERESYLYVDGTTEKYSFKVVSPSAHKTTTPKVEITNLKDSSVKNTDKIVVKVNSTDTTDTRLKNAVFTYSAKKAGVTKTLQELIAEVYNNLQKLDGYEKTSHVFDDVRFINGVANSDPLEEKLLKGMSDYFEDFAIVKEDETKNSFNLDLTQKAGVVKVAAVTINDDGIIAIDEKELTIKNTDEEDVPEITIHQVDNVWKDKLDNSKIAEFQIGQGKDVKLPTVYVNDVDKTLNLNVMYYIGTPENSYGGISYLSPTGKRFSYDSTIVPGQEVQVIDGGKITTSETGIYYVVYSATDVAGNTSVMYFTFEVVDTSKPILSVEPVGEDITISGNTIEGYRGTVIDFETTLRSSNGENDYTSDHNITVTVDDDGKGLDYQLSGNSRTSYMFNDYGTYIVTISGQHTVEVNGEDETLIADSKVIKINIVKKEIEWLGEIDIPQYAKKGETLRLPDIAANNDAVVKVTYVTPGGSESEAEDAKKVTDENGYTYWEFKTSETAKGTYTVIYTATNAEDTLVVKKSVKVGDNVAPVLNFNKGELTQDLIYDGEHDIEYVVEMSKSSKTFVVKAINNGKEVYSYNIGLNITDKDDTGTVTTNMAWSNLSFELTGDSVEEGEKTSTSTQYLIKGTGKYALKLTIKDSYNNERTEVIEFNVVSKSEAKENNDTVIGAVLIVISLILLAGVILFFTFTGKKGGSAKKSNKVRAEKKEETTEVVVEEKENEEPKSGEVE